MKGEGEADIYQHYKQFQPLKKCKFARKIMCFIMNVIIARQNFSAYSIYLFFSKFQLSLDYVLKQEFKPTHISLKVCYFH